MKQTQVWLITGVSGGLGRALAVAAAKEGHTVYGTLRKQEETKAFEQTAAPHTHAVVLDVTHKAAITQAYEQILRKEGRIDVLVNNAGYGLIGGVEEATEQEFKTQFETNFFGALAMTQAVLPIMRKQQAGWILQISSSAGFRSAAGFGVYNASKFALEGLSEALALEMKPFGVQVVIVEPGPFRTDFAGRSAQFAAQSLSVYEETVGVFRRLMKEKSGTQDGDPDKAAQVILQLVKSENPPLRLPLGAYAIQAIRNKLAQVEEDITQWESLSAKTSFED